MRITLQEREQPASTAEVAEALIDELENPQALTELPEKLDPIRFPDQDTHALRDAAMAGVATAGVLRYVSRRGREGRIRDTAAAVGFFALPLLADRTQTALQQRTNSAINLSPVLKVKPVRNLRLRETPVGDVKAGQPVGVLQLGDLQRQIVLEDRFPEQQITLTEKARTELMAYFMYRGAVNLASMSDQLPFDYIHGQTPANIMPAGMIDRMGFSTPTEDGRTIFHQSALTLRGLYLCILQGDTKRTLESARISTQHVWATSDELRARRDHLTAYADRIGRHLGVSPEYLFEHERDDSV